MPGPLPAGALAATVRAGRGARAAARSRRPARRPRRARAARREPRARRRPSRPAPPRADRRRARAARRASRRACSPSRARRRRGGARPGISTTRSPSQKTSVATLAVPAGEHDGARAEREHRARELGPSRSSSPVSARASGTFGVATVARGRISVRSAASARARAAARRTPRRAPGRRRPASPGEQVERLDDGLDRARVGEHPELDGIDAEVLGDGAHLRDDHRRRDGLDRASRRPCSAP